MSAQMKDPLTDEEFASLAKLLGDSAIQRVTNNNAPTFGALDDLGASSVLSWKIKSAISGTYGDQLAEKYTPDELQRFVTRATKNGVLHYDQIKDDNGNVLDPNVQISENGIFSLDASSFSVFEKVGSKVKRILKRFGLQVADVATDLWEEICALFAGIDLDDPIKPSEHATRHKFTRRAHQGVSITSADEIERLKRILYEKKLLKKVSGGSFVSGTWPDGDNLKLSSYITGDVEKNVYKSFGGKYLQFTSSDVLAQFDSLISSGSRGELVSMSIPGDVGSTTAHCYVTTTEANRDITLSNYDDYVKAGALAWSNSSAAVDLHGTEGDCSTRVIDLTFDRSNVADDGIYFPYKISGVSISSTTFSANPFAGCELHVEASGDLAYGFAAPVIENGSFTSRILYTTLGGSVEEINLAEIEKNSTFFMPVGYDGDKVTSAHPGRDSWSTTLKPYSFPILYSLAPITIVCTSVSDYKTYLAGKKVETAIYDFLRAAGTAWRIIACTGMGAGLGTIELDDKTGTLKKEDGAVLPDPDKGLEEQYPGTQNQKETKTDIHSPSADPSSHVSGDPSIYYEDDLDPTHGQSESNSQVTPVYDYDKGEINEDAVKTIIDNQPTVQPSEGTDPRSETISTGEEITTPIPGEVITPIAPTDPGNGGLWAVYNPSLAQIQEFGKWLWTTNPIETLKKMFQNPMDAIISLHKIYTAPTISGESDIVCGYLDSGVKASVVSERYKEVDCGEIYVSTPYSDFTDYYTDLTIFLPFVGMRHLDTAICMGATLHLSYIVDVYTGSLVASLSVQRDNVSGTVYQWAGSMYEGVPLTASDMSSILGNVTRLAASAVTTAATGGATAAITAGDVANTLLSSRASLTSSGNLTGNSGALAEKTPYLVYMVPNRYGDFYGWKPVKGLPDNRTGVLSFESGYVEADSITGGTGDMTDDELSEVRALLDSGVYLP